MDKKVSIVMVNYNGAKFQNECIRSIKKSAYANYEIIVVDNNSNDDSVRLLEEEFEDVIIIKESVNHGWAEGNNVGIKYAIEKGTDYIMLLNNDTEISESLLENLMRYAKHNQITVPKMYYYEPKDLIWYAGGKIDWNKGIVVHEGQLRHDGQKLEKARRVNFATGCCMLIHKSIFKDIGMFDPNYFMYYDDVDFCVRANKAGYKIIYFPAAVLWHKVSSSSGGINSKLGVYYNNRNRLYFMDKFKTNCTAITYVYTYATRLLKIAASFLNGSNDKIIIKAFIDYHLKRFGYQKL